MSASGGPFEARVAADCAAREAYGRLLARLAKRTRDIAAAEDALSDAFTKALQSWPNTGVPQAPEAWLTTVALNTVRDAARRRATRAGAVPTLQLLEDERCEAAAMGAGADERLALILAASHPAIAPAVHAPLILQVVFGVTVAEMAPVFLLPAATIAQRLVRAKAKIKAAGIPFEVDPADRPARLTRALDAVYALYTIAVASEEDDGAHTTLAGEAQRLSRLIASLATDDAEALGLAALIAFNEARRPARRGARGDYVPMSQQDPSRWNTALIEEAEGLLLGASRHARPGPYQLQAAIQSVHCDRRRTHDTRWGAIAVLYDALTALSPSVGAVVAKAAAYAEAHGPEAGLAILATIEGERTKDYQPYWATRAHLEARAGRSAAEAYSKAIALARDTAVKAHLVALRNEALDR